MITVAGNGKSPGILASIRTVLQVFWKESRKGSSRFRNLGSDRQLTAGKLNYLGGGSVHGRAGRYRLAAIKITGKGSRSGREAADFSGKQCWAKKTAAGNDRHGVQNGRA